MTEQIGMPPVDETLPSCDDVEGGAFCVDDQDRAVSDIAVYVASVAGTGVMPEAPTDGKGIFTSSCGGCHVLADAGTEGTVGPNLDQSMPPKALVVDRVTNGQGAMPSFKDSLDPAQIDGRRRVRLLGRGLVGARHASRGPGMPGPYGAASRSRSTTTCVTGTS